MQMYETVTLFKAFQSSVENQWIKIYVAIITGQALLKNDRSGKKKYGMDWR